MIRPLPPRVESGIYRITQEALANVGQHAQATEAMVTLAVTPGSLTLTVADDGIGFDPETVAMNRFGLIGVNERVKLLNGRLQLQSSPGEGTRLEIEIPLV